MLIYRPQFFAGSFTNLAMFNFFKKDKIDEWKPLVEKINAIEPEFEKLTDIQLKEKTSELKLQITNGKSLDEMLVDAFALVREASKRTLGQRHFDVQVLGGIALHKGMTVEMMTGEGKTLVATLPTYLNALEGKGAHVITVNDYLAQRDAVWMGQIYDFLGLSVGCITHDASYIYDSRYIDEIKDENDKLDEKRDEFGSYKVIHEFLRPISRKEAYAADIVYGTNHEFGFDYLRDNLVIEEKDLSQRNSADEKGGELHYAIIDEVDSILIDEARTPLIISSYEKEAEDTYNFFNKLGQTLKPETHFTIDEKRKSIFLTEEGQAYVEKVLKYNPYQVEDLHTIHHLEESLKANFLFHRDKDYIVKHGQVVIVDEFTGRLMAGRRWSGGLHQAIESKEGVAIQPESKTVASITIQNLFKRYKKLSGMSGTVITSAEEFHKVYGLESIKIPTNKQCVRIDNQDKIFMSQNAKWNAIVEKIKELYSLGRPILVGTTSIEKNELLHRKLTESGILHNVLNAKNHEEEGNIIAQAGRFKAVTVATNMAGRGVDIVLGGIDKATEKWEEEHKKVLELGGLFVLGTERHEARRIDNQLRGRTGRQGDSGETQFYISLDDELVRIFGGDSIKNIVDKFKIPEDQAIENSIISKIIEEAQGKVEGLNFDMRKHLVEYDNVVNAQREKIYDERKNVLLDKVIPDKFIETEFNAFLKEPLDTIKFVFQLDGIGLEKPPSDSGKSEILTQTEIENIQIEAREKWENHFNEIKSVFIKKSEEDETKEEILPDFQQMLKTAILRIYDYLWSEHLSYLDEIKESVGYRAYGQRDPLIEFKKDALESFDSFHKLFRFNLFQYFMRLQRTDSSGLNTQTNTGKENKIGRNESCPCGAKKSDGNSIKYKHCHGK